MMHKAIGKRFRYRSFICRQGISSLGSNARLSQYDSLYQLRGIGVTNYLSYIPSSRERSDNNPRGHRNIPYFKFQ